MKLARHLDIISDSATLKINALAKRLEAGGAEVINFSAGEPDIDTPEIVKVKAKNAIEKGLTKYTPVSGIEPLRLAIARRYAERYGVECIGEVHAIMGQPVYVGRDHRRVSMGGDVVKTHMICGDPYHVLGTLSCHLQYHPLTG